MTLAAQARIRAEEEMPLEALVENIAFLLGHSVGPDDIATRVGASRKTIARRLRRHGHIELSNLIDD